MLRRNIAATSLKILLKNLYSVKCCQIKHECIYIKSMGKFRVGLYFDQFTIDHHNYCLFALLQKFLIYIVFNNHLWVSVVEFRKCFTNFMIMIS